MGRYLEEGEPVISVDAKKKELIGEYAKGGREWQPSGEPERFNVHDFADRALGEFAMGAARFPGATKLFTPVFAGDDESWLSRPVPMGVVA